MIYGVVVKQYEVNKGVQISSIDESGVVLEYLEKEQNDYRSLLENNYLSESEREILEAKYEVIQEAVIAAIIVAIITIIAAVIIIMKSAGKVVSTGTNKIMDKCKKLEEKYIGKSKDKGDMINHVTKDLESRIEKQHSGPIKRLNGAPNVVLGTTTMGPIKSLVATMREYIGELERNRKVDQYNFINELLNSIKNYDIEITQFDKNKLSLIDINYYKPDNKEKLKINIPSVEDFKDVYIRYINNTPTNPGFLDPQRLEESIKQMQSNIKVINENIKMFEQLEKDFKKIEKKVKVNSNSYKEDNIDNSSFLNAVYNILKVIKNNNTACVFIANECISLYNVSLNILDEYMKELEKDINNTVNDIL